MQIMNKELKSYEVQRYLDALDIEPPRKPYCKGKTDKIRDAIRQEILKLKQQEDEKLPTRPS